MVGKVRPNRPNRMVCVVLVGKPFSGKSEARKTLESLYGAASQTSSTSILEAISAGVFTDESDEARRHADIQQLLADVGGKMQCGALVEDRIVVKSFMHGFNSRIPQITRSNMFVSDGYPRTHKQAELLREQVGTRVEIIPMLLKVSDEDCFNRMPGRQITEKRTDDTHERLAHRLQVFSESFGRFDSSSPCLAMTLKQLSTLPEHAIASRGYFENGFINIDASQSKENVATQVTELLAEALEFINQVRPSVGRRGDKLLT
ncbi:MAG TPA: nucleoside monophosphate kinase [Candidatus Paceibacterota bacterium]|nr:nucleoside monophosphate kinase [Candidatus Paceibacterota bacterium]